MGQAFKFRLSPLLRIRQAEEDRRKEAFALALGGLNRQVQRMQQCETMLRSEHRSLRQELSAGPLDPRRLAHHRRYVNGLIRSMVDAAAERNRAQRRTEQARVELAEAARRRKVIEKLRDRRRQEWTSRQDRIEMRELDEAAITQHRRRGEQ